MSLIDSRNLCDECGRYRTGFASGLSSACTCPDYAPVKPARHQIGAPRGASSYATTRNLPNANRNDS